MSSPAPGPPRRPPFFPARRSFFRRLLLPVLLLPALCLHSFSLLPGGGDPPGRRWRVIDTPHFRVIFPRAASASAARLAALLEELYGPLTRTLDGPAKRLPVILHDASTVANGWVTLMPWRADFLLTPPADAGDPVEWLSQLALHEGRHAVQFRAARRGFIQALSTLLGEAGWGAGLGLLLPSCFWEGDAVTQETAWSAGGRGRDPRFWMELRARLLTGGPAAYDVWSLGSLRRWTPDPYQLGYFLVTYLRRHHGADIWQRVIAEAAGGRGFPHSLSRALRRLTGRSLEQTYAAALDETAARWRRELESCVVTAARRRNPRPERRRVDYCLPRYLADGRLVAWKRAPDILGQWVALDERGGERRLAIPGVLSGLVAPAAAGSLLAWSERRDHPRWTLADHADIRCLDTASGRRFWLSRGGRFFSPALSPDGRRVAAVRGAPHGACALVILDVADGRPLAEYPLADGAWLMTPAWAPDARAIAAVRRDARGVGLVEYDTTDGTVRELTTPSAAPVSSPVVGRDHVFFAAGSGDVTNIFAVERGDGRVWQVTSRPFGALHPALSPDGRRLAFTDVGPDGLDVAECLLDPTVWKPGSPVIPDAVAWLGEGEARPVPAPAAPAVPEIRPYQPVADLFRFHSRLPLLDPQNEGLSLLLLSDNLLGTAHTEIGVTWDLEEKRQRVFVDFTCSAWLPVWRLHLHHGGRSVPLSGSGRRLSWRESSVAAGLFLPLRFSGGAYGAALQLGSRCEYTARSAFSDGRAAKSRLILHHEISWQRMRRMAQQDLAPAAGQALDLAFHHAPGGNGRMWSTAGRLYLPGPAGGHSLRLRGGAEGRAGGDSLFDVDIPFPRGYAPTIHRRLQSASLDYLFPLAYPDRSFASWLHCRRLSGGVFVDWGQGSDAGHTWLYRSVGVQAAADLHFFRLPLPFTLTLQAAYRWERRSLRLMVSLVPRTEGWSGR